SNKNVLEEDQRCQANLHADSDSDFDDCCPDCYCLDEDWHNKSGCSCECHQDMPAGVLLSVRRCECHHHSRCAPVTAKIPATVGTASAAAIWSSETRKPAKNR